MPRNPESPPAKIAVGLASKTGLGGATAALIPVLIDVLSDDAINDQTRNLLLKLATVLASVAMIGRFAQAVAVEIRRGVNVPTDNRVDLTDDSGYGLVEVGLFLLIVVIALAILFSKVI